LREARVLIEETHATRMIFRDLYGPDFRGFAAEAANRHGREDGWKTR
jgi:hypothetical protein